MVWVPAFAGTTLEAGVQTSTLWPPRHVTPAKAGVQTSTHWQPSMSLLHTLPKGARHMVWVPAFAGTTLEAGVQTSTLWPLSMSLPRKRESRPAHFGHPGTSLLHTLLKGARHMVWVPAFAGTTLEAGVQTSTLWPPRHVTPAHSTERGTRHGLGSRFRGNDFGTSATQHVTPAHSAERGTTHGLGSRFRGNDFGGGSPDLHVSPAVLA
jgi:hypothetical protein